MNYDDIRKAERAYRRDFDCPPSRRGREKAFQAECAKASGPASGSVPFWKTNKLKLQQERYAQRRAAGLCACGKKPKKGRKTCPSCLARRMKYHRKKTGQSNPRNTDINHA